MSMTKAELQMKHDALKAEVEALREADREFRNRILNVASKAAYDHELCHVLDETLAEIGIDVPTVEIVVESATVYRLPLTDVHRAGFLDPNNDLKAEVEDQMRYGMLSETEAEDFGIDLASIKDKPVVTNVTIKQPV